MSRLQLAMSACAWSGLAVVALLYAEMNGHPDGLITSFICWCGGVAFAAVAYGLLERHRKRKAAATLAAIDAKIPSPPPFDQEHP